MYECTLPGCPDGKTVCCNYCPDKRNCKSACEETTPKSCGKSVFTEDQEAERETAIATFQSKAAAVIQAITDTLKQKAAMEAREKEMRVQLEKAMEEYGITKFETPELSLAYIPASNRRTVDSKKLQAKFPDSLRVRSQKGE